MRIDECSHVLSSGDIHFIRLNSRFRCVSQRAVETGEKGTHSYRVFFTDDSTKKLISSWHDIPLVSSNGSINKGAILNFVCEIPRGTVEKMEIDTSSEFNPVKQDTRKDGSLRNYLTGPLQFNYGALPQTWEDPNFVDPEVGFGGDNDPVDVIEVGADSISRGSVLPVRVLGVLCLIDQGEVDWKVLAVRSAPQFSHLRDLQDLNDGFPTMIPELREWLRTYKVLEGKKPNEFGFKGEVLPEDKALDVIHHCRNNWCALLSGSSGSKDHGLWLP